MNNKEPLTPLERGILVTIAVILVIVVAVVAWYILAGHDPYQDFLCWRLRKICD